MHTKRNVMLLIQSVQSENSDKTNILLLFLTLGYPVRPRPPEKETPK